MNTRTRSNDSMPTLNRESKPPRLLEHFSPSSAPPEPNLKVTQLGHAARRSCRSALLPFFSIPLVNIRSALPLVSCRSNPSAPARITSCLTSHSFPCFRTAQAVVLSRNSTLLSSPYCCRTSRIPTFLISVFYHGMMGTRSPQMR
jgi:hypothetical protein